MKALRRHKPKDLRIENIPEPSPGPEEVKIKIEMRRFCGRDLPEKDNDELRHVDLSKDRSRELEQAEQ